MVKKENGIEELSIAINTPNLSEMSYKYRKMVKQWASYVDFKLNNDRISCPITLFNEVAHATDRLQLINEYHNYIEYCSILQGIIDPEINKIE